ncbi:DNA polymerase III subunit alpha [Polynucleobacter victoriensis]|uniref:DNA polymerase III subunit alpha n=1 Tax=Polynucleobacter victoriensis TaxID=2049319 RepID=A0A212T6K6_9BURK|nr:DNA polymerase III subunit alpha [Polynucleobacter victoriensis]SNC61672.1 DNA polymerase-3 subunit alpha [Polynucleobacter victoriensis]
MSLNTSFVHLRLHSEYSIVDGAVRIDDAISAAVSDQMGALALTDLGNVFGLVKFYQSARKEGLKPIVGSDVWISNPEDRDKPYRLQLLVKNHQGYLNLCELLTKASLTNQYKGRAEVDLSWFKEHAEGLIALSGARFGDVGVALLANQEDEALNRAKVWAKYFPGSFYIEIQRAGHPQDEAQLHGAVHLANQLKLPVVATHSIQFMKRSDFTAHEARVCIAEGEILANPKRVKKFSPEQYFKSQAEMQELFADLPAAITNSVEIAKRCNLSLTLGKPQLPDFPVPAGMTLDDYLMEKAMEGLSKHLIHLYPDEAEREKQRANYEVRLKFEARTISQMGFPGYFLIVADFINWAKNNGVPVGPGRGSGAGSLVAYSLGITDLDPLRYNLLFERFLNPERVSMPDFDIDFCQHGRDRVIAYVKEKYGKDAVSQIATFGTMAARAAIRDVGRVLEQPYGFVDGISKLIPNKPGQQVTIEQAKKDEKLLAERESREEEVKQLLGLAQQLEGMTRNVGMHAGGVLIAPGKLTDFCPLYTQGSKDGGDAGVVSQFDKDDVEAVGLVKFDFLGLTTLTIIDWAERYIHQLYPDKKDWRVGQVPLDDPAAFEILKNANTVAVFQLESRGMQGMLREAKPDRFEDIIALVALYRPGPMDLIPSFIARKHGKEQVHYPDPRVEPVLRETYGIMVYQEQVMQMAQIIGGYSLGGADLLRRAMGKKKPEEMAEHRQLFRDGSGKSGLKPDKADEIFDLMEKFAGYGFNKSHAAAYALLAYHTAWLKAHYPAEFMAANMSLAMDDTDKVKILYEDALANKIKILPPDVNTSVYRFMPLREDENNKEQAATMIRYGLGAIRGTGEGAIEQIIQARANGPFVDLFDFCLRLDRRVVNRRTMEALIRAGAFDSLYGGFDSRSTLLASLPRAMEAADQADASAQQVSLFDMAGSADEHKPELVKEEPWFEKRRLQEEKAALGLYLTGHLFDAYRDEVSHFVRTKLNQLTEGKDRLIAGIMTSTRSMMGPRGKLMIATIDDGTAQLEMTIYSELFEPNRYWLKEDELIIAKVSVTPDKFSGGMRVVAESIMDVTTARLKFARSLHVQLQQGIDIQGFKQQVNNFVGKKPQGLLMTADVISNGSVCLVQFPETWKIYPDDESIRGLSIALNKSGGQGNVEVKYA